MKNYASTLVFALFINVGIGTLPSFAISGSPFWISIKNETNLPFTFILKEDGTWDRDNFPPKLVVKAGKTSKQYKTAVKHPISDQVTLHLHVTVEGTLTKCKFTTDSQQQKFTKSCKDIKDSSGNTYTMRPSGLNTNLLFTVTQDK